MKNLGECVINSMINEMAYTKSQFEFKLDNLADQILQNWCLVKWCDDNPKEQKSVNLRNHWASELKGHMKTIINTSLKSGRKDKVIKNVLIDRLELNDSTQVARRIRDKFNKEELSKYINTISQACSDNIEEICNVLYKDEQNMEDYIHRTIG